MGSGSDHGLKRACGQWVWPVILALFVAPGLAWAQIDEVVVSVRKRAENLQDVPIAVQAFGDEKIQRQGIRNVADVAKLASSIQFNQGFAQSDTRIVVRGLAPTRGRQNVALLVDGIDVSSESITSSGGSLLLNTRLLDIERIEVVLGPQMALYGRSAFNGALQYITRDPSEAFETELKADVNDQEGYELVGAISGPILGDALGYRINATWWDQKGFYDNTITNDTLGGQEGYGVALTLKSELGDNLSMKFRAEYTNDSSQPSPQAFLLFNTEMDTPPGAFAAGVAECNQNLINALSDWNNPNNPNQGVPGNNENWLARGLRILDPNYVASLDPDTLDPTSQNFVIPAGGGSYCEERTPSFVGAVPDGGDLKVRIAPDPRTPGKDFEGFDRELMRLSFVAQWEEDNWSVTSLSGYTLDDNTEAQDTNAFAFPSAAAGEYLDGNVDLFMFNNKKETEQISQDIRFQTSLDGRWNGTIGGLFWYENVENDSSSITAQGSGSHCIWNSQSGILNVVGAPDGCTGYTETPIAPYVNAAAPFRGSSPAYRETEHWSIYGNLDFEVAENWTLSFEGRYNDETTTVEGPIFFDAFGASGGPGGLNPCGIFFRGCEPYADYRAAGKYFGDAYFPWTDVDVNGNDMNSYRIDQALVDTIPTKCWQQSQAAILTSIQEGPALVDTTGTQSTVVGPDGNTYLVDTPVRGPDGTAQTQLDANGEAIPNPNGTDYYNPWCVDKLKDTDSWFSPKITLDWHVTDEILVYGSWAKARKPGGFSLLTVGSSGLDRELTEFDAEKMEVWEVGANTEWFENTVTANVSLFFQDFTDKQALTSALGNDGRLVSKIVNAGAAEVWGAELRLDWMPISEFLGGNWRINGSYTWLDPTYTDFNITSGSPVSAAKAGNCSPIAVGTEMLCEVSYTGNDLENAPRGAFSGLAGYYYTLSSDNTAYIETDVIWTDKSYTNITNNIWTEAYWQFNLRVGFQGERWEALLYANNLLDDDTVRISTGGPGLGCCFAIGSEIDVSRTPSTAVMVDLPLDSTAFMPDPRIVGFRVRYRFGG